jgi:hypothetical protein
VRSAFAPEITFANKPRNKVFSNLSGDPPPINALDSSGEEMWIKDLPVHDHEDGFKERNKSIKDVVSRALEFRQCRVQAQGVPRNQAHMLRPLAERDVTAGTLMV